MRLSKYAAEVIVDYLHSDDVKALKLYSGDLFRARFVSRLWMRRVLATIRSPHLIEIGCAMMRLPLLQSFARQVFFGRGSFPDMNPMGEITRPQPVAPAPQT
jgi:hypothetical protein